MLSKMVAKETIKRMEGCFSHEHIFKKAEYIFKRD